MEEDRDISTPRRRVDVCHVRDDQSGQNRSLYRRGDNGRPVEVSMKSQYHRKLKSLRGTRRFVRPVRTLVVERFRTEG